MSDFSPHEAPVKEARALPVPLPGKLAGRETALAQVYAQLKAGTPVLLYGVPGIGKTALAATLAGALTQQPGGVLWMNVDNPRLEELLVRVGRAYQVSEIMSSDNPLGMVGAVENTLKSSKPFIVIDGTVQPDVVSRFISRCVDGLPMLFTSENEADGTWTSVGLTQLEPEQASALFKQESRMSGDAQDIDVYGIVKLLNHLPFAIVLVARAMLASKQHPGDYIKLLEQITTTTGTNAPVTALTASFKTLTGALQGLILMMGATFDGRVSAELLSMVSGAPLESVQQAMNILAQLNLVGRTQRYGEPYYILHKLTHAFAQNTLRTSNRLEDLQNKVQDAVLAYARKYSATSEEAYNKLATEMDVFMAAARWGAANGNRAIASDLVSILTQAGNFVRERGYLYELLQLRELSSGGTSAFPAYGEPEEAVELLEHDEDLAPEDMVFDDDLVDLDEDEEEDEDVFDDEEVLESLLEDEPPATTVPEGTSDLSTLDESSLRSLLAQVRQSGEKERQIGVLKAIGDFQVKKNMENEAIATYNEVLNIQEDLDDQEGVLDTLDMLSALMVKTENSQAAVMHASRGIKLAEEQDDQETKLQLHIILGDARQQLGESEAASEAYSAALQIARMTDDKQNEAIVLYKLGFAQLDNGDAQTSIQTWERALALFKSQEKRGYEGRVLGGLGSAYGDMDRWAEAVNFHTSALHIAREVNDKDEEVLQLGSLAFAATRAGQLGEAVLRYRQALHLAYQNDNVDNIVTTIVDLVRLLLQSRKHVSVAELLINDAIHYEPHDKDVVQLKEQVDAAKQAAAENGTRMIEVTGTAKDYAENAYDLLEA